MEDVRVLGIKLANIYINNMKLNVNLPRFNRKNRQRPSDQEEGKSQERG